MRRKSKGKNTPVLTKDAIAELLHVNPKALEEFEKAYQKMAFDTTSDNFFEINSRQAAEEKHVISDGENKTNIPDLSSIKARIVDELLVQTKTYVYDGNIGRYESMPALPSGTKEVENSEITVLPESVRPELTGNLMKVEIKVPSSDSLLYNYNEYLHNPDPKKQQMYYHLFRQGLDILDLDGLTYEIIGTNPNSIGHWFPALVDACTGQGYFKIPRTTIAKVPLTMLQLTRLDYRGLTPTTLEIVNEWAYKAFKLDKCRDYFIKTGTYSSKFDFRNAHVQGAKEVGELGEYLLYIHHQALQMASPLSRPCIYGVSTTNEWVVREFISDKENNPCIYKGLPLHTEYRVFIDCDTKTIVGIVPYWEPETMKKRFGQGNDANSPHQIHDYIIYKSHEPTLMGRYEANKDAVVEHIGNDVLPHLNLKGQWSLDIMQNGDDFWLIDMALAETSAFYDCVPKELRHPAKENWIPQLPEN